jgi:hypothetical protein
MCVLLDNEEPDPSIDGPGSTSCHHHLSGAPTTAMRATTVPALAAAFAIGAAARHLMTL